MQEYVYLGRLPVAVVDRRGIHYVHTDHLGTPRAVSEPTGSVIWHWYADPFGTTVPDQKPDGRGGEFTLNLRFPGQYFDLDTGRNYNWNRYYDPQSGRYLTSDPIGLVGGINLYTYVDSKPVEAIDPLGLKQYSFKITIGGGVGYYIIGGGVFTGEVTDSRSGESCQYQIRCFGLGVGLPEVNVTSKPITYDDGKQCSKCKDFEGLGYIGGASGVAGGGITVGGGIKFPNGPFVPSDYFDMEYGGFRIGVSHSACYFRYTGRR